MWEASSSISMATFPPAVFDQKIGKPAVLVDVGEGVLGVEIAGFLGAEGVGEQFNEQILGTAAGGGAVGRHGDHLTSFALVVQPAGPFLEDPAVLPERWDAGRFSAVSRNAPRPACRARCIPLKSAVFMYLQHKQPLRLTGKRDTVDLGRFDLHQAAIRRFGIVSLF